MQNHFRIKNDPSLRQMLNDQRFEHTDLYMNFISPWNHVQRVSDQVEDSVILTLPNQSEHVEFLPINQKITPKKAKIQRSKTEESKYSSTITPFRKNSTKIDQNLTSLYTTDYFIRRNSTTQSKFKRNRQIKSREKFSTPVININQFTFNKDRKIQMTTLAMKLQQKFESNINYGKSLLFQKQICNVSLAKCKKRQLRKQSAQKVIPMKRMTDIQRSKKLKKELQNLYSGHGALIQNLKRTVVMQPQQQKIPFRQLKCRSANKFNRTIF